MSCPLPQEILDLVVGHLHNDQTSLGSCCLVSKSWVHRARTHLFATVDLRAHDRFERWKETFPDPANSPAHHARTLLIDDLNFATAAHGCFISAFCGLVRLYVGTWRLYVGPVSLVPMYGLSPPIRSLRLSTSHFKISEIFDLICSLPLLENLSLDPSAHDHRDEGWDAPPTLPRLTGSLEFSMLGWTQLITSLLSGSSDGIRFTKTAVSWDSDEDVRWTTCLVSRCPNAPESRHSNNHIYAFMIPSFDLFKAPNIGGVVFQSGDLDVQWIIATLRTAGTENLQRISLVLPDCDTLSEAFQLGWLIFDYLLISIWTKHSLRPKVTYEPGIGRDDRVDNMKELLPQSVKKGIVDMVEYPDFLEQVVR